jgi:hypothetical protein
MILIAGAGLAALASKQIGTFTRLFVGKNVIRTLK